MCLGLYTWLGLSGELARAAPGATFAPVPPPPAPSRSPPDIRSLNYLNSCCGIACMRARGVATGDGSKGAPVARRFPNSHIHSHSRDAKSHNAAPVTGARRLQRRAQPVLPPVPAAHPYTGWSCARHLGGPVSWAGQLAIVSHVSHAAWRPCQPRVPTGSSPSSSSRSCRRRMQVSWASSVPKPGPVI
jgi:hypothetical protein